MILTDLKHGFILLRLNVRNCEKLSFIYLFVVLPGKLTENTFSFAATTWGIVTGERRGMNEPIVNWGLLGDRDGLRARLGI